MTASRIKLFWQEIDLIQARHALFFPKDQKRHISIMAIDSGTVLLFSEQYNLPKVITLEVEFAFRLATVYLQTAEQY